jgi:hypothetical protein
VRGEETENGSECAPVGGRLPDQLLAHRVDIDGAFPKRRNLINRHQHRKKKKRRRERESERGVWRERERGREERKKVFFAIEKLNEIEKLKHIASLIAIEIEAR